jgi:hypothetical protein
MPTPRPVTISLPWCEADIQAYVDAIEDALRLDAARNARMDALTSAGRVALSIRVYPAHYTACTLPDAYEVASCAIENIYGAKVAKRPSHMGRPTDRPRIHLTIAAA